MRYFSPSIILVVLIFCALLSFLCALAFGAADLSTLDVARSVFSLSAAEGVSPFLDKIIWQLRMPRTLLAFIAGAGLAMSGVILQTVTRNPLADPYLFGISSGASFGVVLLIAILGSASGLTMSFAAFIGSLFAMTCLILVAGAQRVNQVESMLLAGVALSFLFSSFTSLLLYLSDPQAVTAILFWTLGSFARASWDNVWFPAIVVSLCIVFMLAFRRQLNAMLLGDESATTLGINVNRFRLVMLVLSSLITATLVSLCGGIGFVGLMIPHIVRFFVSQGSSVGLLITAVVGGIFMIWVDVLSRVLLANQELPVGVITAAIGSFFFLGLLSFRKKKVL
ncbi:MAG: FecCD family ABC transporter permease [Thalassotalea sp.]